MLKLYKVFPDAVALLRWRDRASAQFWGHMAVMVSHLQRKAQL